MQKRKNMYSLPSRVLLCTSLALVSMGAVAAPSGAMGVEATAGTTIVAQTGRTVKGVVTDKGEPIIGANVLVKGTANGTITDLDGRFSLNNVPSNGTLVVSFIGYLPLEVKVGNQQNFAIELKEDSQTLDEVIVVGYGSQKKANLTGSVGQVDSKVLESRPVMNASSALQGTIPNLQITPQSGAPGATMDLNVRGTTSINGGGPLVLVDGVEMDLSLVNPNDIANVTVLKDAAASAIYGVRAAYGVILVTTKTAGNNMKTTVSYSGNVSLSTPTILPDMVGTSWEHAEFINRACGNAGATLLFRPESIEKMKAYADDPVNNPEYEVVDGSLRYYGYSNLKDEMLKKVTPAHTHNINISGGNEKTKFYSSIGYVNQSGMYKHGDNSFQRLNTRLNVDNQTTPWLKLGAKVLYNYTTQDIPHKYKDDVWQSMVFNSPAEMIKPWKADPRYPEYDSFDGMYMRNNTIAILDQGGRDLTKKHDVWLTGSADFTFMPGWKARVDFTYNLNYTNKSEHRKEVDMFNSLFEIDKGDTNNDDYKRTNINKDYYSFNAYTEYEHTFAEKHYLKAMAGFNQELTKYNTFYGQRKMMLSQDLPSLGLATGQQTVGENGYEWALRGGFFRLNYIYSDRYLVEVNGRYDGTSRFPSDNRFVFLPSFSAAWRISEEKFMESTRSVLDNLKLRASYGILGNQLLSASSWSGNTKYYPYVPFMSSGTSGNWIFGSEKALLMNPATLVTSDLTWEKAKTINFGVDVTMFKQRLDFSFDYYQRTTSDMLVKVSYPEVLGITAPPSNLAELRTDGWELSLKWRDRIGKDFSYDVGFILSDSQAEITKYDNPTGSLTDRYVGQKIGEIWGYETEGIFQTDEEVKNHPSQTKIKNTTWKAGDIKYKNLNDDNEISKGKNTLEDHGDLKIIGNETPRYQYGITANLTYKDFYLNLFMQGVGKRDFWPSGQPFWPAATEYYCTQKWFISDSWSETNPEAYFARPIVKDTRNQEKQTRYLQDASYLRMKNLSIGYNIPSVWLKKVYLSKATVYVSGENLFEFSKIKGPYDPEAARGNGTMLYPFMRTYSLGINLTF